MSFEIRPLTDDDVPAFRQELSATFGYDADLEDEAGAARFGAVFDNDRMFPAFDGHEIVGTGGDFAFDLTVPGGSRVPTAGLTIITVRPTHTRQGVLTAMMREHCDRAREREEPLGGLWASEVPIYGRYGYGASTIMSDVKLDARFAGRGGSEEGVTVRLVGVDEARKLLPGMFDQVRVTRPGMYSRSDVWWKHRIFSDPEAHRDGASSLRYVIAESNGEAVGYALYRQKSNWSTMADGEIRVRELIPVTASGYRTLWHFLVSIDLFPIVKYWNNPIDDPLHFLLRDGRAAETKISDALWTRLIDLPAALEARTYERDGSIVLRVEDEFCGWNDGTYRLSVSEGVAQCEVVVAEPDVSLPVATLGSLYMGGHSAQSLARVDLLQGDVDSVGRLDDLFRSYPAPWCQEIF